MSKALLAAFFLLILSACSRDKTGNNTCASTCDTISFKADIIPIFTVNCALSGCHNVANGTNHYVNLDSAQAYASITQTGTGYIVAGNPSYSVLLGQLYRGATEHMPNNGGQLDACDIQKISCWIQQGALNN